MINNTTTSNTRLDYVAFVPQDKLNNALSQKVEAFLKAKQDKEISSAIKALTVSYSKNDDFYVRITAIQQILVQTNILEGLQKREASDMAATLFEKLIPSERKTFLRLLDNHLREQFIDSVKSVYPYYGWTSVESQISSNGS